MTPLLKLLIVLITKSVGFVLSTANFTRLGRVKLKLYGLTNAVLTPVLASSVVQFAKSKCEVNRFTSIYTAWFSLPWWTFYNRLVVALVIMLGAVTATGILGVANGALFVQSVVSPVFCCGPANYKIVRPVVRPVSVNVVNNFISHQKPTDFILCDKAVLHHVRLSGFAVGMTGPVYHNVPVQARNAPAFPARMPPWVRSFPIHVAFKAESTSLALSFFEWHSTLFTLIHPENGNEILVASQCKTVNNGLDENHSCTPIAGARLRGSSGSTQAQTVESTEA